MESLGKALVILGFGTVVAGVLLLVAPSNFRLFRLPGDVWIERPGFTFGFPLVSMLLISGVLTLVSLALGSLRR